MVTDDATNLDNTINLHDQTVLHNLWTQEGNIGDIANDADDSSISDDGLGLDIAFDDTDSASTLNERTGLFPALASTPGVK